MKICPTCNKEFPDDQKFCKYDGTPLAEKKAEAESGKKCPKCGRTYPTDAGFCMTCGTKLVALDEKSVCASCGAELPEGAAFCMKCGAKAGESGESVEEKISTRDLSEIDENHLEKYDLTTLCWARSEDELSDIWGDETFDSLKEKLDEYIKIDDVLTEEEKTHDIDLQRYLANAYGKGIGCKKSDEESFNWGLKAAERGVAKAQYSIGCCYSVGSGCRKNEKKAFDWIRKSAMQGYTDAQIDLADRYRNGKGCEANAHEAFSWYKMAAEQGVPSAEFALAKCYEEGYGCDENEEEAFRWYKAAADHGYCHAQYELAECYSIGYGCNKDDEEAFEWYKKSAFDEIYKAFYGHLYLPAVYKIAQCLWYGIGCEENLEDAIEAYKAYLSWKDENDFDSENGEDAQQKINYTKCAIRNGEYSCWNGSCTVKADCVQNISDFNTRNLKLILWFANKPYHGGTLDGYFMAEFPFDEGLDKEYGFTDVNKTSPITGNPPAGEYYPVMTVNEQSEDGSTNYIVGWKNFNRKEIVQSDSHDSNNAQDRYYKIDTSSCVDCGTCISVCPVNGAIVRQGGKYKIIAANCVVCGTCAAECPAAAIY